MQINFYFILVWVYIMFRRKIKNEKIRKFSFSFCCCWLFISKSIYISATCIHDETQQQRACNRATHSLFFKLILSVLNHFRNTFFLFFFLNKKKNKRNYNLIHILLSNTKCLSKKMVNIIWLFYLVLRLTRLIDYANWLSYF